MNRDSQVLCCPHCGHQFKDVPVEGSAICPNCNDGFNVEKEIRQKFKKGDICYFESETQRHMNGECEVIEVFDPGVPFPYLIQKDGINFYAWEEELRKKEFLLDGPCVAPDDVSTYKEAAALRKALGMPSDDDSTFELQVDGKYNGRGVFLSSEYDWEIVKDDFGGLTLVPFKKP